MWRIEIFMIHPQTMSVQSHTRSCNIDSSEDQHSDLKTLSVDKIMHNIVLLRDDVMRDKEQWQMESCQGFFSQIWLMTELSRGRHTSQNTESAELLHKPFLHLCPSTVFSHFIFPRTVRTRNDSLTQRHSCNLCKHNREPSTKDLGLFQNLVYCLHRQVSF